MKDRYVFPVSEGPSWLEPYSVLAAKTGSLRLIVPSSGFDVFHILTIIGVVFGYFGAIVLIAGSPFYQQAAPWRYQYFNVAITIGIVAGAFALLIWEERSVLKWTIRFTSRHPRGIKMVQPVAVRPGRSFQELSAVIDGKEVTLRIEASQSRFASAISLSRTPGSQPESGTDSSHLSRP